MTCEYCNQYGHTIRSCREITPVVKAHRQKIEKEFNSFTDVHDFQNWLSNIPFPVLKRLAKSYKEKMTQTRAELEKKIIYRFYKVLAGFQNNHLLYNKFNARFCQYSEGYTSLQGVLTGLNEWFSCRKRFINWFGGNAPTPLVFMKRCKAVVAKSRVMEAWINERAVLITTIHLTDIRDELLKNMCDVRTFVERVRQKLNEDTYKKTGLVLKRLDFNTCLFRHIVSFL